MCNDVVDVHIQNKQSSRLYLIDFLVMMLIAQFNKWKYIFGLAFHINNHIANELCFQMKTTHTNTSISIQFLLKLLNGNNVLLT